MENREDPDIAMAMYYLLEYSSNYPMASSLCNYYRHEINNDANENNDRNN